MLFSAACGIFFVVCRKEGCPMKKLFTMIRQGKLEELAKLLDKNPALIS